MATHPTLFIAPTRIGDAVLASSVLAHILAHDPDSRITLITSSLSAPLFAGMPNLERTIALTKRSYNRHWIDAWRETVGTRWHAVWDMRNSALSYGVRARSRHIYLPPKIDAPKVQQYAAAFGLPALPYPVLWPRAEDTAFAKQLLGASAQKTIVFAPIANWAPKQWPLASFIALARALRTGAWSEYRPIIICAGHERAQALPMLEALADFHPIDLTTGDAPLLRIYAVMQRAQGFVGNDSGLMHMAAAAGIPTLGIFGPTPSRFYQPWGGSAAFIHAPGNDLAALPVEAVQAAFMPLLQA